MNNARAILAGTSRVTKHGAYSELIDAQLRAALAFNDDPQLRIQAEADMEVMSAVNLDDPTSTLKTALLKLTAKLERMHRLYFMGRLSEEDHLHGITILSDQIRKLTLARHQILGSASDEQEEAINYALSSLDLDGVGEDMPDSVLDEAIQIEARVEPVHPPSPHPAGAVPRIQVRSAAPEEEDDDEWEEEDEDGESEVVVVRIDGELREQ